MSLARARTVFSQELAHTLKRPLFWSLVLMLVLMTWGLSTGNMQISSGDASVGGTKAWITSEFSFAFALAMLVAILYSFFGSIASGMAVVSDDESKISEMLLATPLRPAEYVWGKFAAILAGFLGALGIHLLLAVFFNHVLPNPEAAEIQGPFQLVNYLRPVPVFALPGLIFYLGVAFFLGERWRRPVAVHLFPIALLILYGFFLWDWAPTWLDPRINRALMLVDPAGFRWLNETWLKLDRGADFYNRARIGLDAPFVISRLAFAALGLLGVVLAQRHLAAHLQGETTSEPRWRLWRRRARRQGTAPADSTVLPFPRLLNEMGMRSGEPGILRSAALVAGTELRNLLSSPGLYLFGALILIQTLGSTLLALGAFQTELLLTPGLTAVRSLNTLSLLLCLLLMFYTVESLERERSTGLAAISFSTPARTASLLFGKVLANSMAGLVMVVATFLGCAIAILVQGKVSLSLGPYLLVWGVLLTPTLLVWTSFVLAVQAVGGQRYLTYGIGLGAIALTFYLQFTERMNWVGNWWIWGTLQWSDMGLFELNRKALLLNRVLVLGLAALFTAVAVQAFGRRQADAIGTIHRLQPVPLWRRALRLAPLAAVPLVAGVVLGLAVGDGFQGGAYEKKARDYWKQNLATWKDAPQPAIANVDVDLRIEPGRRWLASRGSYALVNDRDKALRQFALTGGPHWEKVSWTLNGKAYKPENRSGLYVFTSPAPLKPGDRVRVGWQFEGSFPHGITKNGGGASEFILVSGVVLTSFSSSFAPVVGYMEEIGRKEDENDYEERVYPDDFYEGPTDVLFGVGHPFTTRIAVTAPADYTFNSVGAKVGEKVADGRRTVVWKSDYPVRLFNVAGGRWAVRRGHGTAIFHHPGHGYNIDEMIGALDAARRWYSQWFQPFPWRELKLSEFPNLATYAQGFPTDITFSEGIGFLTKSDVKTDAVFLVTAHESAHQWWGNLLTPGKGPGGNLLSEGMSHYSAALLFEQVKGARARMEFLKRIEENYGDERRADAERPLVKIDGSRDGDTTATYDKGGWVFWMMDRQLGRERMLAGLRKFMADWGNGPDYPVLQDFTAAMRPFAPDPAAYDAFVQQWFHQVVVPEYRLSDARLAGGAGGEPWRVTVRVKNVGSGRVPIEVAASRGERFPGKGAPRTGYRDARRTVFLGPGEEKTVEIPCSFHPERVVADPDVEVLQLRRKAAVAKL
ncbi:MAG TPA: ABC transporter permease subunit [Thermoanaerobaculia bacterium]|jgi:ABC-type transport system involved in multi-copper enzyme maturation permease subunit